MIIQRILSLWLNARRLRQELYLALLHYPLTLSLSPSSSSDPPTLQLAYELFLLKSSASISIILELTGEELLEAHGEMKRAGEIGGVVEGLGVDVAINFGMVE